MKEFDYNIIKDPTVFAVNTIKVPATTVIIKHGIISKTLSCSSIFFICFFVIPIDSNIPNSFLLVLIRLIKVFVRLKMLNIMTKADTP